jgi:hypothetical protein
MLTKALAPIGLIELALILALHSPIGPTFPFLSEEICSIFDRKLIFSD